jgi:glycosyltransferase involved in cell wall biosynthesis
VTERCHEVLVLKPRDRRVALARSVAGRRDAGSQERATHQASAEVRQRSNVCDVTLLHGPHVSFLAHRAVGPVVLQTVDPWSIRVRMEAELTQGWRARYRKHKSWQALKLERNLPSRLRLLTVGARDAEMWAELLDRRIRSIANGVEQAVRTPRGSGPPVICFVGSLNYGPNIASVRNLIMKIAPAVWLSHPDTRFLIAGRQPTPEVLALAGDRVEVIANVPSVIDIFHRADVAVFPDEHGVGIRNSVSEALAAGLPVVASPAAAREQPPHTLLAVRDGVAAMVAQIESMLLARSEGKGPALVGRIPQRTWLDASLEYLDELNLAVTGG